MSNPGPGGTPPPPGWTPPASPPSPPPPGWAPPATATPTYPPAGQPPAAWGPAPGMPAPSVPVPGMLGAAHKPGAMPLRPLGLGDMYDAAFRIIRFNPKATVGSAVLVAAVAMAIPVVITAILTATVSISLDESGNPDEGSMVGLIGSVGSLALGTVLGAFGTILVTGMIAHVTAAAAVGRRLSLSEAWAATRGKRWRLVGLVVLLGLAYLAILTVYVVAWIAVVAVDSLAFTVIWGIVTVPLIVCFLAWFWVRIYYLPVPALMLEPVGILGALRRGFALTRKQFWRTFGIGLLTLLVGGVAGYVLTVPFGIVGQVGALAVGAQYALLVLVATQALSQVISAAFVTPFTSSVTSLQYLDQRMRKEAYDVELMQQAGITRW